MVQRILTVTTRKVKEVVDITDRINSILGEWNIKDGLLYLFLMHTTAALTIAELDPGTDLDLLDALGGMVPKLSYRHSHNPSHVSSHILSALVGASLTLPVENGKIMLGTWQRAAVIEFDGPRERQLILSFQGGDRNGE